MSTAADITPGVWVRFPSWTRWRYVFATRHVPFRPDEPRGSGFVHYDAADWPGGSFSFGGFSPHEDECRIVTVTPEAVTS